MNALARVREATNEWVEWNLSGVFLKLSQSGAKKAMKSWICLLVLATCTMGTPRNAYAQSYTRTDVVAYYDNYGKWVLGQVASSTNTNTSPQVVEFKTDYDPATALPLRQYGPGTASAQGKLQQTLTYDLTTLTQLGTVKTIKDGNGNVTTLSGWQRGIPQNVQYPATPEKPSGATEQMVVSNAGWITSVTDENGYATSYGYDAMGRLNSIVYPIDDSTPWNSTALLYEKITANEPGVIGTHWRQTITTGAAKKITYYDAMWRPMLTREYDANSEGTTKRFQRIAYDYAGRTSFTSYPGTSEALTTGSWSEYDVLGRPTSMWQDQGSGLGLITTSMAYLPGYKVLVTNPKGQQTTTSYLAYDQPSYDLPVAITHPEGAYTDIVRDVFGKPTSITRRNASGSLALSRKYVYRADWQTLCKTIEPETGATVMDYDGAGNLGWSASGLNLPSLSSCNLTEGFNSGRRAQRTYDARNRVKTLAFPDGNGDQAWSYTPDGLPSLVAVNNPNVTNQTTTAYTYNKRRLLTGEGLAHLGSAISAAGYGYNSNGHLATQTYPSGLAVSFAPNALGQPTQAGSYASEVSYYPNGAIKGFKYGNNVVHTMTQNAQQMPWRSTDAGISDLTYSYDKNSNVISIIDELQGTPKSRWMTYDGLDRLLSAGSQMFGGDHWHRYTYDVLDNLVTAKLGNGVKDHSYVYDTGNRLANVVDTPSGATLVGLGYDAQGNLANKNGQLYVFDYGNRLRSVTSKEWYAYDGLGRRALSCTTSACAYQMYSQSGQLLYSNDQRNGRRSDYIYLGGSLVATRERPLASETVTVKYQHTDALGTPVATTSAAGLVLERSEYEPYGQLINRPLTDGPGFTGHAQDAATDLTYMQQRYYDPMIGRFLSVDPVTANSGTGANFNRYWYGNNNPYKFMDPDGRQAAEARADELNSAANNYAAQKVLAMLPKSAFVELGGSAQGGVVAAGGAAQGSGGLIRPLLPTTAPGLSNVYLSGGGFIGGILGSASVPTSDTPNFVAGASAGLDASLGITNVRADSPEKMSGTQYTLGVPAVSVTFSAPDTQGNWSLSVGLGNAGFMFKKQEVQSVSLKTLFKK